MSFRQMTTVSFQGMVLAFARSDAAPARLGVAAEAELLQSDIYYNVLSLDVDSASDALDWDGWRRLDFPNEVRPAGMQLVNVPAEYRPDRPLSGLTDAGMPFKAITNQEYVYLLRQAVAGTILVTRFRLVRRATQSSGASQEVEYVLDPAWEVRFQRSGKPDVPRDDKDTQGYLSPDKEPFLEPSFELPIPGLTDGNFDAALLPRRDGTLLTCTIFVANGSPNQIDVYELPLDASGRFLLAGKALAGDRLAADFSFQLTAGAQHTPLTLAGRPALTYYLKQERTRGGEDESFLVKRSGRLLMAMRATVPGENAATIAMVDLGAAADGTVARPAALLSADPVGVASYTAELQAGASIAVDDLVLTGSFGFEVWLYPSSDAARQLVIGNPHDAAAPRLSLVDGSAIEVGFSDAHGAARTAVTARQVVRREAWSRVKAAFDKDTGHFSVWINGDSIPVTETGAGTTPGGVAITSIGAASEGFSGEIDSVAVYNSAGFGQAALVGDWPLDAIVYSRSGVPVDPPETPNRADPAHPGKVEGAHLVPSTSPAATGNGGALSWDARGLSIVTSYFDSLAAFDAEIRSSPELLASADGLVHCYFQGKDDRLSVMQLDVEVARAVFEASWHTAAGAAATGPVQLVATQAGAYMNQATIVIADPAGGPRDAFCDLVLTSPSGRTERWNGVPRSLALFARTLNGESVADPADPRLLDGALTFFDSSGTRTSAYVALPGNAAAALAGFVTRFPASLPLTSVQITAVTSETVDLTFQHAVPRWTGTPLTHTWRGVPARIGDALRTLDGASLTFAYKTASGGNIKSYSIGAESGVMDADTVIMFAQPTVLSFDRIAVTARAGDADHCDVEIVVTDPSSRKATWTAVPRRQDLFALTLEGTNPDYDYATRASGFYREIGAELVVTTNGTTAAVDDVVRAPVPADDDLRVYGSLVEVFVTAATTAADLLPATGGVPLIATAFQKATATTDTVTTPITGASQLFGVQLVAVPSQGSVGLVDNTTALTNGTANLIRQGLNGGWRNQPGERTLTFANAGYVTIDADPTTNPAISAITLTGDLSFGLWCRPQRSNNDDFSPNQRLLTFARTPTALEGGGPPVRFLAGLQDQPSLICGPTTTIRTGVHTLDGTFLTWFNPIAVSGNKLGSGTIGALAAIGITLPLVTVSLDGDARVRVDFTLDPAQPPITTTRTLTADDWCPLALPFTITETRDRTNHTWTYSFAVDLYQYGVAVGHQTWTSVRQDTDRLQLVTMLIGEIDGTSGRTTLPMRVNETALFSRALGKGDCGQYAEQRIPDNAPELAVKWMLREGVDNTAHNSAPTGPLYDAPIQPSARWEAFGLYMLPALGHGDNIATLVGEPLVHGWAHLALSHQAGYALHLTGRDYANCGHEQTVNLGDRFSIEAWVQLDTTTAPARDMTIVGKGEDYALEVTVDRVPRFSVKVDIDGTEQVLSLDGKAPLSRDVAHYLAATYEMVSVTEPPSTDKEVKVHYEVHMSLWADGVCVADGKPYTHYKSSVERVLTSADLELGRTGRFGGARYLRGYLSDTRLWNRVLSADDIRGVYQSRRIPFSRDGLVCWWRWNEQGGRIGFDSEGNADARLNRGDLRSLFQPTSSNLFFVDGRAAAPAWVDDASSVGGYPDDDLVAFARQGGDNPFGFYGQLDAVQLWDVQLTGEQIADSMNRRLSGSEKHLRGLWTFDNGSGPVVEDQTGRGNRGTLTGSPLPVWATSTAPLGNEAAGVINILGGVPTPLQDVISEPPAVVEYGDLQRDAYGSLISVMKRAYLTIDAGDARLATGFKVGDLDTVYLGQAQSRPSVIGFIEGAPPIPSENQTMPHWLGGYGDINGYGSASSVSFDEADETTYLYTAERDTSDTHALQIKGGFYAGDEIKSSVGIGAEVETTVAKYEGHLGLQGGFEFADHSKDAINRSTGTRLSRTTALAPGGAWEPGTSPADWVNPIVGRRYVPANTGLALVKSLTVDVYASILTTTRTTVKISTAPNPDIPEDVNLLTFPIDPTYVKNGTLDGKVGLENDPSYRNADQQRGSYFKPLEAYALKRRIERDTAQLEAYYQQYDASGYASKLRSADNWDEYRIQQQSNTSYDWPAHLSRRNLVNTYVWTAAGGTYAEQSTPMNVYTESFGAISSRTGKIGAVGDVEAAFPVFGFYADFDYLYSWATEVNVVRQKESSSEYSLAATAAPDGFLYAPRIDGDTVTFPSVPTEGKVDAYRYMAFFLAPTPENFDAFRDQVVDPVWRAQSMDPAAVALREATPATNGSWRVLYRVTYVSRIPPRFQPVPDESRGPDLTPPANLEYNALLVALIKRAIGKDSPTPLEIGAGIAQVLGTATAPGPIAGLLPWWPAFLVDANDYRLSAAAILRALREDLLRYMIDTYAYEGGHA